MEPVIGRISVRRSVPGDEPELKKLWRTVFEDPAEYIDAFFDILYSPGVASLAFWDDNLISAGYCLPGIVAKGKKCAYIYAMATYPEHRGYGAASMIAHDLANGAFAGGTEIVATLPATQSLVRYYEKVLGMKKLFKKGLPGAEFPESWHRFNKIYAYAGSEAPDHLWAVGAPGVATDELFDFGWELTFE